MARQEHRLGLVALIPPGEGRTFEVAGRQVAVFRTRQGRLFASQADCPHRAGPLADGMLGETTLVCPLHDQRFDLETGAAASPGACAIAVYPVRVTDDREILLTLDGA